MKTVRARLHRLRRVLKAKLGQARDRGALVVAAEIASHAGRLLGARAPDSGRIIDEFDAKYGTDTSGIIQPWDLDIPDRLVGQAIQYSTADTAVFNRLLESLDIEHENYLFIDLGSGKGRALMLASRFAFRQILGVELSAQLEQTARMNLSRFHAEWQRCTNIGCLCQDAATYELPPADCVLYLFNPFGEETLRAVVARLEASLRAAPRRVYVVYVKAVHRNVFEDTGRFTLLHSERNNAVYVNDVPARAGRISEDARKQTPEMQAAPRQSGG